MKTNFQCIAIGLVAAALLGAALCPTADAQYMDPAFGPPSQGMGAALPNGALDGPLWLRYTPTTDGLGFDNSYTTLGGLLPLWNASGDGIWFTQAQGHVSSEGRLFANLGFGGRIYEHGIRRTFGLSAWFDYDGDRYENFGHDFYALGVTFDSFGDKLDFHINGYCPIKDEYTLGGPEPCFVGNQIVLVQGIDAGLRGTDFEAGLRLPFATIVDPRAYVGGYFYGSHSIDPFLGLSTRVEIHPSEWTTAQVRVTTDEQFGVSTMFNFELHMGGRRHRPAYDRITEPVHRNDHIVRYHQDPQFAINPLTGQPYQVYHVNNDPLLPASGQGTFESPFTTLAQAEMASAPADVILVYGRAINFRDQREASDFGGTYTGGIVLKDNQKLYGTGITFVIRNGELRALSPVVNQLSTAFVTAGDDDTLRQLIAGVAFGSATGGGAGQTADLHGVGTLGDFVLTPEIVQRLRAFVSDPVRGAENAAFLAAAGIPVAPDIVLCSLDNLQPTITNPGGIGVRLANNNEVANVRVTGSNIGIFGDGITNFNIHDNRTRTDLDTENTINGVVQDGGIDNNVAGGILLQNVRGQGRIVNNTISDNNRPNPPRTPDVPYADGVEISVTGADSLNLRIAGNEINRNDTGVRLISNTSGVVAAGFQDNFTNNNVNDGINILGLGTGLLVVNMAGGPRDPFTGEPLLAQRDPITGIPIGPFNVFQDPITGELRPARSIVTPPGAGAVPEERFASSLIDAANGNVLFNVASTQSNTNGDINKLPDTNGNGRGFFADIVNGQFQLVIDRAQFVNNDSSFFPRYGAIQLNVEPQVTRASARMDRVVVMGTGLHDSIPRVSIDPVGVATTADGFLDAGSGIRIVTNPGLTSIHQFAIDNSEISFNFSDGIKFLMLTEGLRTAAIPEGIAVLRVQNNLIASNVGIADDNGAGADPNATVLTYLNNLNDYDSPGNLAPFPVGLLSNPHLKNEFTNNINGSGLVVRAKGTDNAFFLLNILDNQIVFNEFDQVNLAFAGRGNIDYVPSPQPGAPPVVPPVPLTPVRVYDPIIRDPINDTPLASALSPDTFGVNATVIMDNNRIGVGVLATPTGLGAYDDAVKVVLLDGSKVQMRISNNLLVAGDGRSVATPFAGTTLLGPGNIPLPPPLTLPPPTVILTASLPGQPAVDRGYDTAIEIDTWDTSRLALVVDNNDITAAFVGTTAWQDGGLTIQSHENSILATRITRNRINEVLDSSSLLTGGAAINLLAEGNSQMIAFVTDNDLENRNGISNAYFEATSADNAMMCLQLLDNNGEAGQSQQLSQTLTLDGFANPPTGPIGDAFFLVQTELSTFEIEPTRGTNHETIFPESLSIETAVLAFAGPGPILPTSDLVQFGNVPSGSCETRVRALQALGFPFDLGFPGLFNFDPPVIHP
jgi:hypothetical protein